MSNISVLGSGGWGTALAILLCENGHNTTLWSFQEAEASSLTKNRENPFLPGISIPEGIAITNDIQCVYNADIVVIATPSFAVLNTAELICDLLPQDTIVVNVSKGVDPQCLSVLSAAIATRLNDNQPLAVLSGPSHAEEVARGVITACVVASNDEQVACAVQNAFMNTRFRVYTSDDMQGVELGGALKNVIALAAGISDGLGLGDNTKAALMTRGIAEIARLGVALGGKRDTFNGLSGIGDLIVTCTSMHSRNRRCGILIGQGIPVDTAVSQIGAVVEGFYATKIAYALAQKAGVDMPIVTQIYKILCEDKNPHEAIVDLMMREKKNESHES